MLHPVSCSSDGNVFLPDQQRPIKASDLSPWTSADFLDHYFSGNGAAVDLNDIGLLKEFRETQSIKKIEAHWEATVQNSISAYLKTAKFSANEHRKLTLPLLLNANKSKDPGIWYEYRQDTHNPLNPIYAMGGGGLTAAGSCTLIADENGHVEWSANLNYTGQDCYKDLTSTGFEPPGATAYPITFSWASQLQSPNFSCAIES